MDTKKKEVKEICGVCLLLTPIILFVLYLFIFCPKKLPEFQVISVSVNPFNLTCCSQITANWNITFNIRNCQKKRKIAYELFNVYISYEKELLSGTAIKPFYQNQSQQNLLIAKICASSIYVSNQTAQAMEYELITNGTVNFDVTIQTKAYISTKVPETDSRNREDYDIWVSCDNLEVKFLSNTYFGGAIFKKSPSPCKVSWDIGY